MLHDIGMSRIPQFIRNKETPLKGEEKEKLLLHQAAGIKILQKLNLGFDELVQATMEHHERLDGSGYPNRTRENQQSKFGRLCVVADSFSAMITKRVYAAAKDPAAASKELADDKTHYDSRFSVPLANAYLTGRFDVAEQEGDEQNDAN